MKHASTLVLLLGAAACQTPQRWLSQEELVARRPAFVEAYKAELEQISVRAGERVQAEYTAQLTGPDAPRQSIDILVLSGGGAFGAFGAGFLDGWGSIEDPEYARPVFDTVSGISTGSLIAPFAFVGTDEAYAQIIELYENPGKDWVNKRGLIPYLPGNVSVYDISKLHNTIRNSMTPEIMSGLAAGAQEGRQLLVGTTNVDFGLLRVWDLAHLAFSQGIDEAWQRTVNVMLASSAIPGVFPPIEMDDFYYVDGGTTMQMVGGIDQRGWAYESKPAFENFELGAPPIRARIWIIVNQKLLPDPSVVQSRWTSIAARSLGILLRSSSLQSIQDVDTFVQLLDQRPDFDAKMHYIAIPQEHVIEDSDQMFDAQTMRELVRLGREMGADPSNWKTKALLPGAPFE